MLERGLYHPLDILPKQEIDPAAYLVAVDTIPALLVARRHYRTEAESMLAANMQQLREGNFDAVPVPVDALGTARRVTLARDYYGSDSPEHHEIYDGLVTDCRRLFAEAYRKNSWEYFAAVRQDRDEESGDYYAHGQRLLDITAAGLSPVASSEEQARRVNEHVEELTYSTIGRLLAGQALAIEHINVMTISECTDDAIAEFLKNPQAGSGGYVAEIEKFMVRNITFMDDCRYEEQIGVSGIYITREIIAEALVIMGALEDGAMPSKSSIHGMQMIGNADPFVFIELLDRLATEYHEINIFMGEPVDWDFEKDYTAVREQAAERQAALEDHSYDLADYLIELVEADVDVWAAAKMTEEFVKQKMFIDARNNPEQAAIMFDRKTADGYARVLELQQQGFDEAAVVLLKEVERNAPPPEYCGPGASCGLREVSGETEEAATVSELLKADKGDKIVKDEKRPCKQCGKMSVYYAYTETKVNKGCVSCRAFESKHTWSKNESDRT